MVQHHNFYVHASIESPPPTAMSKHLTCQLKVALLSLLVLVPSVSAFSCRIGPHDLLLKPNIPLGMTSATNNGEPALLETSTNKRKRRNNKEYVKHFWSDANDDCIVVTHPEPINGHTTIALRKSIQFTIRGKPLPLNRHRTSRGFMYNPSAAAQEMFRDSILTMLPQKYHPTIIDDGVDDAPCTFFSKTDFLEMSIVFRLKRPKTHFVNSKPGEGRIKDSAPKRFHASKTDVDNLAKFVLDSLNGILYEDDRQVVSLKAVKMLDSEGMCHGATDVTISVLEDE